MELFSLSGYRGSRPVLGEVNGNRFRIQKRRYWRNDFAPQFYGKYEPERGGTRIEGYFDLSRPVKRFMRFWVVFVVVVGTPIFFWTLRDVIGGGRYPHDDEWIGLLVPPGLILWGWVLPIFGRLLARSHEQFLLEFLERTLAARIEDTRAECTTEQ